MSRKKLTNKQIAEAIDGLSKNDEILYGIMQEKYIELQQVISLYLECVGHTEKLNKFVKAKEELGRQKRSEDKEGA